MHILKLSNLSGQGPEYKAIPALARDGGHVPKSRSGHTGCIIDGKIIMFGGHGDSSPTEPLNEAGRVWMFDPSDLQWSYLDAATERYPRVHSHAAVAHNNALIVHGGFSGDTSTPCSDTWSFDLASRTWTELPSVADLPESQAIIPAAPPNLTIVNDELYLISGNSPLESQVQTLHISAAATPSAWNTLVFPTNPLTPGPRPRQGALMIPITTAISRSYLLLALGAKVSTAASEGDSSATAESMEDTQEDYWSELWTWQLPASNYTPSQVKDVTRSKLGLSTGQSEWAEVEIVLPTELPTEEGAAGKLHPGPRGYFGSAAINKTKVVVWGGINPRGDVEGDGWIIEVKA